MIRNAAAVILYRGAGADLEVFLVERSPRLRFLGGYHAFPGGVIDEADGDPSVAAEVCARRELFEETGVLLGDSAGLEPALRERVRAALLAVDGRTDVETASSSSWFDELPDAAIGGGEIAEVCRVLTPPFAPIRYDTWFYLARLPDHEDPSVREGELVSGRFWRPLEVLAEWTAGRVPIAPPILILLEVLATVGLERFPALARGLTEAFLAGTLAPVRFTPGVIMATLKTETVPPATTTNAYLVGNQRVYLIDPGSADEDELARLHDLMVSMVDAGRELGGVLLTHHHPDHASGAAWISDALDLEVRGHELTLSRLDPTCRKGAPIHDGEVFELGDAPDGREGWTLRAIHTPGHARGHLCFQEDRYHAILAGDMVSTVSTIVIDPPEGHLQTYLDSLQRLLALPHHGTLYPAHGPPAQSAPRILKRYLTHRQHREDKLVAALGDESRAVEELLPIVYDDIDPRMFPLAARSLTAGLEKLQEEGRVSGGDRGWTLV